mgnify:CR=1 FL=1
MIIAVETIQKAIHFVPNYDVEYAINERKGKSICNRYRVEFPVVSRSSWVQLQLDSAMLPA